MSTQILYKAEAMVYGAKYKLQINDIPFAFNLTGEPLNAEIPVNEFLINTSSVLNIELLPVNNIESLQQNSEVKVILKRYVFPYESDDFIVVAEHTKEPGTLSNLLSYGFSVPVNIEIPYYPPLWSSNKLIDIFDRTTLNRFYTFFEKVWDLFDDEKVPEILNLFGRKFTDYEKCYYLEENDRLNTTTARLNSVFSDPGYVLVSFAPSIFKPMLMGNGKLISLFDAEGYNYIMYYNSTEKILVQFPIYAGIDERDEIYICL